MTKKEVIKTLAIIKVAYPNSFRNMPQADVNALIDLWIRQFSEYDCRTVECAIDSIISTDRSDFMPSIGTVKDMIIKLNQPNELTEHEAWNLVYKAARNGIGNASKEFDKLPPVIQKIVGEPRVIYEYAIMDSQQFNTVAASNFMRSYRARAKYEREMMALPESVKEIIGISTKSVKLID